MPIVPELMFFNFFSNKTRVRLSDFCLTFYETDIFGNPEGIENHSFHEFIRAEVGQQDTAFLEAPIDAFKNELEAVRIEIFGIVWLNLLGNKSAINQCAFTLKYLKERNKIEVWHRNEKYNQTVAKSSTLLNLDGKPDSKLVAYGNSIRTELFKEYVKSGSEPEVVARALNRMVTETAWKKNITPTLLAESLCEQLNTTINDQAIWHLTAILMTFYEDFEERLKNVKIIG